MPFYSDCPFFFWAGHFPLGTNSVQPSRGKILKPNSHVCHTNQPMRCLARTLTPYPLFVKFQFNDNFVLLIRISPFNFEDCGVFVWCPCIRRSLFFECSSFSKEKLKRLVNDHREQSVHPRRQHRSPVAPQFATPASSQDPMRT